MNSLNDIIKNFRKKTNKIFSDLKKPDEEKINNFNLELSSNLNKIISIKESKDNQKEAITTLITIIFKKINNLYPDKEKKSAVDPLSELLILIDKTLSIEKDLSLNINEFIIKNINETIQKSSGKIKEHLLSAAYIYLTYVLNTINILNDEDKSNISLIINSLIDLIQHNYLHQLDKKEIDLEGIFKRINCFLKDVNSLQTKDNIHTFLQQLKMIAFHITSFKTSEVISFIKIINDQLVLCEKISDCNIREDALHSLDIIADLYKDNFSILSEIKNITQSFCFAENIIFHQNSTFKSLQNLIANKNITSVSTCLPTTPTPTRPSVINTTPPSIIPTVANTTSTPFAEETTTPDSTIINKDLSPQTLSTSIGLGIGSGILNALPQAIIDILKNKGYQESKIRDVVIRIIGILAQAGYAASLPIILAQTKDEDIEVTTIIVEQVIPNAIFGILLSSGIQISNYFYQKKLAGAPLLKAFLQGLPALSVLPTVIQNPIATAVNMGTSLVTSTVISGTISYFFPSAKENTTQLKETQDIELGNVTSSTTDNKASNTSVKRTKSALSQYKYISKKNLTESRNASSIVLEKATSLMENLKKYNSENDEDIKYILDLLQKPIAHFTTLHSLIIEEKHNLACKPYEKENKSAFIQAMDTTGNVFKLIQTFHDKENTAENLKNALNKIKGFILFKKHRFDSLIEDIDININDDIKIIYESLKTLLEKSAKNVMQYNLIIAKHKGEEKAIVNQRKEEDEEVTFQCLSEDKIKNIQTNLTCFLSDLVEFTENLKQDETIKPIVEALDKIANEIKEKAKELDQEYLYETYTSEQKPSFIKAINLFIQILKPIQSLCHEIRNPDSIKNNLFVISGYCDGKNDEVTNQKLSILTLKLQNLISLISNHTSQLEATAAGLAGEEHVLKHKKIIGNHQVSHRLSMPSFRLFSSNYNSGSDQNSQSDCSSGPDRSSGSSTETTSSYFTDQDDQQPLLTPSSTLSRV